MFGVTSSGETVYPLIFGPNKKCLICHKQKDGGENPVIYKVYCEGRGESLATAETVSAISPQGAVFDYCQYRFSRDPMFAKDIDGRVITVVGDRGDVIGIKVTVRTEPVWEFEEMK